MSLSTTARSRAAVGFRLGLGLRWATILAAAGLVAACGDDDPAGPEPPDMVSEAQLTFLRPGSNAPPLVTSDTTVVATAGQRLEVELFYEPEPGESQGERFLEFELEDGSLLEYPPDHPTRPGQAFQPGDTIWIRIAIEPSRLLATLEPTGIVFNPLEPAELEIRYLNADDDIDDDGDDDPELEGEIDLWRQENPGDLWERVGNIKDLEFDRVRAFLLTFSRYGLAI
jgi:hypothetical protein